jgi:hypothetical protein
MVTPLASVLLSTVEATTLSSVVGTLLELLTMPVPTAGVPLTPPAHALTPSSTATTNAVRTATELGTIRALGPELDGNRMTSSRDCDNSP